MYPPQIKANTFLRIILILSAILVLLIFFVYRTNHWPAGIEAAGCLISFILLSATTTLLWVMRNNFIDRLQERSVSFGLYLGLLWVIEISINTFVQPGLPYRDRLDDAFFFIIALLTLSIIIRDAYQSNKFLSGLKSGLWIGFASGAIACLAALLLIVFGMKYLLSDPLNIKEWSDSKMTADTPNMAVYFAYQTLAGAIMHIYILGVISGLVLGSLGGLTGLIIKRSKMKHKSTAAHK
jgi:hypothetical protein